MRVPFALEPYGPGIASPSEPERWGKLGPLFRSLTDRRCRYDDVAPGEGARKLGISLDVVGSGFSRSVAFECECGGSADGWLFTPGEANPLAPGYPSSPSSRGVVAPAGNVGEPLGGSMSDPERECWTGMRWFA